MPGLPDRMAENSVQNDVHSRDSWRMRVSGCCGMLGLIRLGPGPEVAMAVVVVVAVDVAVGVVEILTRS